MNLKTTMALGVLLLAGFGLQSAGAGDWPMWGGNPHRNMYSEEKNLPTTFDPGKKKAGSEEIDMSTTKNVKWAVKLGSQTYGNPTIAGGRIFIGTNNESPRDPRLKGDKGVLMCFDEASGKFNWQLVVHKLDSGKVNDWEFLGIMSSALVEGERLYLVTNRCEVLCLDVKGMADGNEGPFKNEGIYLDDPKLLNDENALKAKPKIEPGEHDADIIWRYDMMDELGVFPHNASNCSMFSLNELLYVVTSNGQDWSHTNIPAEKAPSFIALNKKEGKFAGEDDLAQGTRIFHGLWSNPSMGKVGDQNLVFYGGGDGWLYAFDSVPQTAEDTNYLKHIWKVDANPAEYREKDGKKIKYPSYEGPSEIISTPVFYKDRVYVAIGQDPEHGEGLGQLICVEAKTGKILWANKKIHRSMSTCAIADGLLYIADFSGFIHCFDAETGEQVWVHDAKSHFWSSALAADGKVYLGNEAGDFYIFQMGREKKILNADASGKVTNFGSPIMSTPVVANGVLYVATQTHLYAIQEKK